MTGLTSPSDNNDPLSRDESTKRQRSQLTPIVSILSASQRCYEDAVCERCSEPFRRLVIPLPMVPPRKVCEACLQSVWEEARREETEAAREKIRAGDGISQHLRFDDKTGQMRTFASFDRKFNPVATKAADFMQKWAQEFIEKRGRVDSVVLFSWPTEPGVGKTHMALAAANYIEDNWPIDLDRPITRLVRFESGPGLAGRSQATYNVPDHLKESHETTEDVYRSLIGTRLLILDDVGKETGSEAKQQVYFRLLDSRQSAPVIVTINLPLEGKGATLVSRGILNEPTVSRLYGMCGENYLQLTGEDYRRRIK